MINVVLLDGQTIQATIVAKQFKKNGYHTILICDDKNSYGYRTRFGDERIIGPSTQKNPEEFHVFFLDLLKTKKVDVIVPMNDYSAHYLSYYKTELKQYANFVIPSFDVFMRGYDKNELMKVCAAGGFAHPKTVDLSQNLKNADDFSFPALIKPNETTGARGFSMVNSWTEMEKELPRIVEEFGSCHLQEFIPPGGNQYKVEIFIQDNELVCSTVIHKMRFYPEKGGSSCFNQTIQRDDLVDLCYNVLKFIKWEGFADFDLIEDPRDNICKIMEINPRVPACIKASVISGVDFASLIVDASLKNPISNYYYEPGKYLRYFGMDFLWFLKSKNKFRTNPSWFKGWLSGNHYFQDFSIDDPISFIYGTVGAIKKQFSSEFRATKKGMN